MLLSSPQVVLSDWGLTNIPCPKMTDFSHVKVKSGSVVFFYWSNPMWLWVKTLNPLVNIKGGKWMIAMGYATHGHVNNCSSEAAWQVLLAHNPQGRRCCLASSLGSRAANGTTLGESARQAGQQHTGPLLRDVVALPQKRAQKNLWPFLLLCFALPRTDTFVPALRTSGTKRCPTVCTHI